MVIAALAVAATIAGFALAEGDGGDEGAAPATYCAAIGEPLGLSAGSADLIVFIRPRASTSTVEAVGRFLEADAAVRHASYVDQEAALADFRELFADEPEMLERVEADTLPTSYRLDLEQPGQADSVEGRIERSSISADVFDVVGPSSVGPAANDALDLLLGSAVYGDDSYLYAADSYFDDEADWTARAEAIVRLSPEPVVQDVQLLATPPPVADGAVPGAPVLDAARRVADHARSECSVTASVLLPV